MNFLLLKGPIFLHVRFFSHRVFSSSQHRLQFVSFSSHNFKSSVVRDFGGHLCDLTSAVISPPLAPRDVETELQPPAGHDLWFFTLWLLIILFVRLNIETFSFSHQTPLTLFFFFYSASCERKLLKTLNIFKKSQNPSVWLFPRASLQAERRVFSRGNSRLGDHVGQMGLRLLHDFCMMLSPGITSQAQVFCRRALWQNMRLPSRLLFISNLKKTPIMRSDGRQAAGSQV